MSPRMVPIVIEVPEHIVADAIQTLVEYLQNQPKPQPVDLSPILARLQALEDRNAADDAAASALVSPQVPAPSPDAPTVVPPPSIG